MTTWAHGAAAQTWPTRPVKVMRAPADGCTLIVSSVGPIADVPNRLNKSVDEIIAVPAMEAALIKEGADPAGGTPQQFGQFTQRECEKWRAVVRESGATAE